MKVLIVSNLFPPFVMGGAEMAAHSLALWLARHGHEVHVLTSAPHEDKAGVERVEDGLTVERRFFPNLYQIYQAQKTHAWRKMLWHARDHFSPASERIVKEAIDRFQPDLVNLHDLQGIGYNLLRELGRQGLPCVQVLHDFGFLCLNMNMFMDGRACPSRHLSCLASGLLKRSYLSTIGRLAFWSPTHALMGRYLPYLPPNLEVFCNPFPLYFTEATAPFLPRFTTAVRPLRLLYVGQVTPAKGVAFILQVLESLRREPKAAAGGEGIQITIVGDGESFEPLRRQYGESSWVHFAGRVPPENVANFMAGSDCLVIPSLWFENSPLVVRQAMQMSLPILASDIGGLPEFVMDGVNGLLLPVGDADRWRERLWQLLTQPQELERLRAGASQKAQSFAPDRLGEDAVRLFERTIGTAASREHGLLVPHA